MKSRIYKYREIIGSLNKKEIANVYLFDGNENYLKEDVIQKIKKILVNEASSDFNFNMISVGEKDAVREVVEIANTLPLFFGKTTGNIGRLIIFKDIDKLKENDRKTLSDYVSEPAEGTCLILTAGKVDFRKKYYSQIKSNSIHAQFYPLFDYQVPPWVAGEVKGLGRSISEDANQCLVGEVGSDLFGLKSEIEKLVNFIGDRKTIEVKDVEQVLGYVKGSTVFDLQKSITFKNVEDSLKILKLLLDEKPGSQVMILSAIAARLRHIALAGILLKQDKTEREITDSLGINYFYNKYLVKASCKFTDRELANDFSRLLTADVEIKTGKKPARLALEMLVMDICVCAESG